MSFWRSWCWRAARSVEIRVVRGLGHGLDQAAVNAAMREWRFHPARRRGVSRSMSSSRWRWNSGCAEETSTWRSRCSSSRMLSLCLAISMGDRGVAPGSGRTPAFGCAGGGTGGRAEGRRGRIVGVECRLPTCWSSANRQPMATGADGRFRRRESGICSRRPIESTSTGWGRMAAIGGAAVGGARGRDGRCSCCRHRAATTATRRLRRRACPTASRSDRAAAHGGGTVSRHQRNGKRNPAAGDRYRAPLGRGDGVRRSRHPDRHPPDARGDPGRCRRAPAPCIRHSRAGRRHQPVPGQLPSGRHDHSARRSASGPATAGRLRENPHDQCLRTGKSARFRSC